jgi:hypothetical protein
MQCILCKIYFWKVFHKYYNFICAPICTIFFYSCKTGCYSDDIGGSLHDLVMHGTGLHMPKSATPSDTIPALGSSGAIGSGVAGLPLPGSPSSLPLPIDWRRVEDDAEFTCSQVTITKSLLHEMLALVGQNLVHLIWVSLKKDRNVCLCASGLLRVLSSPPIFASVALVSR